MTIFLFQSSILIGLRNLTVNFLNIKLIYFSLLVENAIPTCKVAIAFFKVPTGVLVKDKGGSYYYAENLN